MQVVLDAGRRWTLSVLHLGLACCAVEFVAATARDGAGDLGAAPADGGARDASVLVVAGTVTERLVGPVLAAWQALPEPRYVVSMGACANSGGPYWDSYAVVKGVDQVLPVDVYVPGCPPRPEAVLHALRELAGRFPVAPPRPWEPVGVEVLRGPVSPGDLRPGPVA